MHITARLVFRLLLLPILLLARGVSVAQVRIDEWISLGPPGATVSALAADPSNPNTLYTGTNGSGLFKSTNGGASWANTGLAEVSIRTIAIDPSNTNIIYVGNFFGVRKSTNGGATWGANTAPMNSIETLVIDTSNTNTIYAGTSDEGVLKSTNGGASWTQSNNGIPDSSFILVNAIAIDPTNTSVIYLGHNRGAVKSVNGGASWTEINTGLTDGFIDAIAIDPTNTSVIYAGTNEAGVFKSTNAGASWTAISTGMSGFAEMSTSCFAIDSSNTNIIYAGTNGGGIFKSINGGASWSRINAGLIDTNARDLVIDPSNPNIVYFGSSSVVYVSLNGGQLWSPNSVRLEVRKLAINPLNTKLVYAGTGGHGVFQRQLNTVEILSVTIDSPKKLTISGRNFMPPARVIINNSDRTSFITQASNTTIKLKAKAKKLGLKPGDNSIQVIDSTGAASNVFILRR